MRIIIFMILFYLVGMNDHQYVYFWPVLWLSFLISCATWFIEGFISGFHS